MFFTFSVSAVAGSPWQFIFCSAKQLYVIRSFQFASGKFGFSLFAFCALCYHFILAYYHSKSLQHFTFFFLIKSYHLLRQFISCNGYPAPSSARQIHGIAQNSSSQSVVDSDVTILYVLPEFSLFLKIFFCT